MLQLMNMALYGGLFQEGFHNDFTKLRTFIQDQGLDGIEMLLYKNLDTSILPKDLIHGHHLLYWPNWLNFWKGNEEALMADFMDRENVEHYYSGKRPEDMLTYYRREFEIAKETGAAYMVFHVAHCGFEEVFTFEHQYDDKAVMEGAIELINRVFEGQGPMLLFENLWWPGLTYRDPELTRWFLGQINYGNKGLLLDVSHLMATKCVDVISGIAYVHQILDGLGDLTDHIHAIHLNKTIAGPYFRSDHSALLKEFRNRKDPSGGFKATYKHIGQLDSHMPFEEKEVRSIIQRLKPDYLVHELSASSLDDLSEKLRTQMAAVGS